MKRTMILILCLVAMLCGCQTFTSEVGTSIDAGSWQCRDAPDIHIRLIDYTDEYAFCEISAGLEVGSGAMSVIQFANMVNDGHWDRIPTGEPMLGPPPPNWNTGISDKLEWVRINGSDAIPMFVHTLLPVHNVIEVTEPIIDSD